MDILQEQSIDLIILDLRMPGPVDGEQLLNSLHDHGNVVPIIVLSGWVSDEMSLNSPEGRGRSPVLPKPGSLRAGQSSVFGPPGDRSSGPGSLPPCATYWRPGC